MGLLDSDTKTRSSCTHAHLGSAASSLYNGSQPDTKIQMSLNSSISWPEEPEWSCNDAGSIHSVAGSVVEMQNTCQCVCAGDFFGVAHQELSPLILISF